MRKRASMRLTLLPLVVATALSFGCSKKSGAVQEVDAAADAASAPAAVTKDDPMIAAGLEDLKAKLQQQQYDAAVGSLVAMSQLPKSDAQAAQYRARLRETETALLQRAQSGDVAAQQSAQMLGRMMTGR